MAKVTFLGLLKLSMTFICAGWIILWVLKPTIFWTRSWKQAEERASNTVFSYYGLNYVVYTLPVVALATIGWFYMDLLPWRGTTRNKASGPIIVNSLLGILSFAEVLKVLCFIVFLVWTFYFRISNDFNNLVPIKYLKLSLWQLKYLKIATRFGLLAEACLALLLLPILRGLSLFRIIDIQFEASVRYHIWLGTAMIFFATFHGISTLFIWGVSHNIPDEIWKWQRTGRIYLAGEIALISSLVIWITSLPIVRRRKFEIFYFSHHLYVVFLVFYLFHTGDRHFYMVFAGIFLFGLDKLLRFIQSRPSTCVLSARILPCRSVELILPKDPGLKYTPTSVVFIKVPSISNFQWHPFSVSSSSRMDDNTMSILIKCQGTWTNALFDMIHGKLRTEIDNVQCIPVGVEGPYGPASLDFNRYDSLLLIAGGSGITPFLSILQDISSSQNARNNRDPIRIQLIYVVKEAQQFCMLQSISHLLMNQSSEKLHLKLKIFVTRERKSITTIKEVWYELSEVRTVNLSSTNSSNYAVHGVESLTWMAAAAGVSSILYLIFLVGLNRIFLPSTNAYKHSKMTPSSITDLLIIASFALAMICFALLAVFLRWRRLKKGNQPNSAEQGQPLDMIISPQAMSALEEHEIHFGARPNFEIITSQFMNETNEFLNVGVLACGPETMKESVAGIFQLNFRGFKRNKRKSKCRYTFHSLNFTL